MRAAGAALGGGGSGGEVIYDDPTSAEAIAALEAGEWIHIRTEGQLPSAASTYADALLLGEIPEGVSWNIEGRWSAAFGSAPLSGGMQVFRGTLQRSVGGNAANADFDSGGLSGNVTSQFMQFRVDTNNIYLQTRIGAAAPYTYNLDFWMQQLAQPV